MCDSGVANVGSAQSIQYVTLVSKTSAITANFATQTNQIISLVGLSGTQVWVTGVQLSGYVIALPDNWQTPLYVTGLTNIAVSSATGGQWATFKIETPATASVVTNYVPADAIVIPASTTGNVQIILESSPDLVNWTAASPGTYGPSSATNRFFRVRAAAN